MKTTLPLDHTTLCHMSALTSMLTDGYYAEHRTVELHPGLLTLHLNLVSILGCLKVIFLGKTLFPESQEDLSQAAVSALF